MFGGRSAAYPQADTPTTRQVFGTDCRRLKMKRPVEKILEDVLELMDSFKYTQNEDRPSNSFLKLR
jgi:hypothetical protein